MNTSSIFLYNQRKKDGFVYESTFRLCKYSGRYETGKKVLHKMMDMIMLVFFAMVPSEFILSVLRMIRGSARGRNLWKKRQTKLRQSPNAILDCLNIKETIITTEAMGTQTAIVKKTRRKRADYVLALKENRGNLLEDVSLPIT